MLVVLALWPWGCLMCFLGFLALKTRSWLFIFEVSASNPGFAGEQGFAILLVGMAGLRATGCRVSMEERKDDDERMENSHFEDGTSSMEQSGVNQQTLSAAAKQSMQESMGYQDVEVANDQNSVENASEVAPGYVPSELSEQIIFEISSLMVRPLGVAQGTFQHLGFHED
ncbi:BEACH domain-containing protein C2-like isoform X2 [Magnolia sinica]|uniref:BEACH domain-containing protein C2-like isoform X2 n=1 Tax=Magnolia sinica TaxID=86752 RepID=UPI002657D4E3|nr:BEACH domain-containing protein C2-like isoform X2 [Magnolia sinica]